VSPLDVFIVTAAWRWDPTIVSTGKLWSITIEDGMETSTRTYKKIKLRNKNVEELYKHPKHFKVNFMNILSMDRSIYINGTFSQKTSIIFWNEKISSLSLENKPVSLILITVSLLLPKNLTSVIMIAKGQKHTSVIQWYYLKSKAKETHKKIYHIS
jgi:hypothetical protein